MDRLLSGRRVLVVEDEMLVLLSTEDMLADLGCEDISAAATVDEALAMIEARVFDVAMLDMNLNGDRTRSVADALAAHGVPFLFATGYAGRDASDGHGDRPVLKKPFQNRDLATILTRILAC
jgi:CheY-like chemotaxis protein